MAKAQRQPGSEQKQGLPLFGEIVAGPLAGWRYAFLRFERVNGSLYLVLRCTPPDWPFPQDVSFNTNKDRIKLRAVPGERARRLDALALIKAAQEHGISAPPLE